MTRRQTNYFVTFSDAHNAFTEGTRAERRAQARALIQEGFWHVGETPPLCEDETLEIIGGQYYIQAPSPVEEEVPA
jgi:hypothetical protein